MFEDYLEDAYSSATEAATQKTEREQLRFYRAAVFYASSALESFVNFIADTFDTGSTLEAHERAFLLDRQFGLRTGRFEILDRSEFHRLDEKLRFLLAKFCPTYDVAKEPSWSRFMKLKDLRDSIVHPKKDDQLSPAQYRQELSRGLGAVLTIMNELCTGIFQKPLRKKLMDLTL